MRFLWKGAARRVRRTRRRTAYVRHWLGAQVERLEDRRLLSLQPLPLMLPGGGGVATVLPELIAGTSDRFEAPETAVGNLVTAESNSLIEGAPGSLDALFGTAGIVTTPIGVDTNDRVRALAVQNDGKIVAVGSMDGRFAVVRYLADGSLDGSFGTGGIVTTSIGGNGDVANGVTLQSDGKIVAAGSSFNGANTDFALVRYNPDGSLDGSFGLIGIVTTPIGASSDVANAVAVQADGKIVAGGSSFDGATTNFALARYNSDGSLDVSFSADGKLTTNVAGGHSIATAMVLQANGKTVLAGRASVGGSFDFAVVRYNASGTLDTNFGTGGKVVTPIGGGDDRANALALQFDGKLVVAGSSLGESNNDFALVRYTSAGVLDSTFGTLGKLTVSIGNGSDAANAVALQSDGKIVAAGYTYNGTNTSDFALVRFQADGSFDNSFGNLGVATTPIGGGNDVASAVAVQGDGKIVAAGYSIGAANNSDFALVRYTGKFAATQVVAQYTFYNNSKFDGQQTAATAFDDAAIALDKVALRPGGTASFANYTSYIRGINGIMIDIAALPTSALLASDFKFRVGNDDSPGSWPLGPAPVAISVRPGAGVSGTDRVSLVWADDAIQQQWLRVTVMATSATGLAQPYVFYFGNAVADSGDNGATTIVNASDELGARNHPRTFFSPAAVDDAFDYDRDGFVNATDQILARGNSTTLASALRLISVPPTPTSGLDPDKTPGQNFDLSKWNITLPVNANGGLTGVGKTVSPPQLATYSDPYFYTATDGAMVFYSPVIGAKTSTNTSYTRSELRELNADGSLAAWTVAQGGTMTATVAVNEMPVSTSGPPAREIVGQIHGPDDELTRLYFDQFGKMYYINDKSGSGNEERTHDLKSPTGATTNIPLGAKFDYSIRVAEGTLTVTVTYNGVIYSSSETITSFWTGKSLYFKAGLYLGVGAPGSGAGITGNGAGRASFYALNVVH